MALWIHIKSKKDIWKKERDICFLGLTWFTFVVISSYIHFPANGILSLLFMAGKFPIAYVPHLVYPGLSDEHLGCFQLWSNNEHWQTSISLMCYTGVFVVNTQEWYNGVLWKACF